MPKRWCSSVTSDKSDRVGDGSPHRMWKSMAAHAQGLGLGVLIGSVAVFYLGLTQGHLTLGAALLILVGFILDKKAEEVKIGA